MDESLRLKLRIGRILHKRSFTSGVVSEDSREIERNWATIEGNSQELRYEKFEGLKRKCNRRGNWHKTQQFSGGAENFCGEVKAMKGKRERIKALLWWVGIQRRKLHYRQFSTKICCTGKCLTWIPFEEKMSVIDLEFVGWRFYHCSALTHYVFFFMNHQGVFNVTFHSDNSKAFNHLLLVKTNRQVWRLQWALIQVQLDGVELKFY